MTAVLIGHRCPDLIPIIRARMAKEWGCRESDINIVSVTERVVSEKSTIIAEGINEATDRRVPRYER